jgi:hypothetical protein
MTKTAAIFDFDAIGKTLAPARPDLPALLRAPRVHACRRCSTEPFNAAAVDDIPSLWHHRQKLVRIAEKADELIPPDPEGGSASEVMAIWDRAFAIDEIVSAVRARCIHEAEAQTALLAELVDAEWDANQGQLRDSILAVMQSLPGEAPETAGGASTEPQPTLIGDVAILAKFREWCEACRYAETIGDFASEPAYGEACAAACEIKDYLVKTSASGPIGLAIKVST